MRRYGTILLDQASKITNAAIPKAILTCCFSEKKSRNGLEEDLVVVAAAAVAAAELVAELWTVLLGLDVSMDFPSA